MASIARTVLLRKCREPLTRGLRALSVPRPGLRRVRTRGSARHVNENIEQRIRRRLGERAIVLVGMMGAGKSSVGRRLGARLSLDFVDADTEIEKAANATISDIFETHGEAFFRDGERRVIRRLIDEGARVVATGGGAYIQPDTREDLRGRAVSIWLQAEPDVLIARVRRRNNRPLLKGGDLEETVRRLVAERDPVYAEADLHVRSRDVAHEVVIGDILERLDSWLDGNAGGEDGQR